VNRRSFLKAALATTIPVSPVIAASYGLYEAGLVKVERPNITVPHLPAAFDGLRVAFLTDIHHGSHVRLEYIAALVRTTQALTPDLVVFGGDFSSEDAKFIRPCFEALKGINAPLGVYGVRGNHEYQQGLNESVAGFRVAGVEELTNRGVWLTRGSSRFRLAGVDDLWFGKPDVSAALGEASASDACLVLSHNPDFAETLKDRRVGLVLSGHTLGGQFCLPGIGAPIIPSRYGQKYLKGLVEAPTTQVYISRGLGTESRPMRFNSRPELTLLTLRSA
jgi:predicted MPP superfamily phosphohydrolase